MRLVPWERISIDSRVSGDRVQTTLDARTRSPWWGRGARPGARGSHGSLIGIVRQGRVIVYRKSSWLWSDPFAPIVDARIEPTPAGCSISGFMRPNWIVAGSYVAWILGVAIGAVGIGWNTGSATVAIVVFGMFFVPAHAYYVWSFWRGVPALREDLMDCVRAAGET